MTESNGSGRLIDQWLSQARSEVVEVPVCFRRDLLAEFDRLVSQHEAASVPGMMHQDADVDALAARLVEVHEQIKQDRAEHTFKISKVPYEQWRTILEAHPPTDEQRERTPWIDHDPEAAAPALIAAACIEPSMTVEDAVHLRGFLPEGEWTNLYSAAMTANRTGVLVPKSVSSTVDQLAFELKSTLRAPTDSRSPSSAGG